MAPVATFVRGKTNGAMKDKKNSTAVAPKTLVNISLTFEDDTESSPSTSDSGSEEIPRRKYTKSCSKRHYSKRRSKDVKRYSSFSKWSKEKYDTCSKVEFDEDGNRRMSDMSCIVEYEARSRTMIRLLIAIRSPDAIAMKSFRKYATSMTASGKCSNTERTIRWISRVIMTTRSLEALVNGPSFCSCEWGPKYSFPWTGTLLSASCLLLNWRVMQMGYIRGTNFDCYTFPEVLGSHHAQSTHHFEISVA